VTFVALYTCKTDGASRPFLTVDPEGSVPNHTLPYF
jgi:hypothetical protein